jgi:hypothetical protein
MNRILKVVLYKDSEKAQKRSRRLAGIRGSFENNEVAEYPGNLPR